jgi:hypothetical protein
MRFPIRFAVVVCSLTLLASAATPPSNAAPPTDACKLLTKEQIKSVTGASVSDGSHPTAGYLKMCTWSGSGSDAKGISGITLNLESAASFQSAKAMLQAVVNSQANPSAKGAMSMTPAPGIGDDALFSSVGGYTKLIVKKGDVVLQIVVYSSAPIEKKRDIEKALAAKALASI